MKADGEAEVYLHAFLISAAKMISFTPWPLYLQGKRPLPPKSHQTECSVDPRDSLDALKRREACWKLTPDFFVIYPTAQSQYSPSIQTQIIYVRINNKLFPQVRGTKV